MEHERAQKKIEETAKKAEDLEKLKEANNQKFLEEIQEKEKKMKEQVQTAEGVPYVEIRRKQQQMVKEKKLGMYMTKQQEVKAVKDLMAQQKELKQMIEYEEMQIKKQRNESIKHQVEKGIKQVRDFR